MQGVEPGSQRGRDGSRHQLEQAERGRAIDGVNRARQLSDTRGVSPGPRRIGIGQMVGIGQRVDWSRPIT